MRKRKEDKERWKDKFFLKKSKNNATHEKTTQYVMQVILHSHIQISAPPYLFYTMSNLKIQTENFQITMENLQFFFIEVNQNTQIT